MQTLVMVGIDYLAVYLACPFEPTCDPVFGLLMLDVPVFLSHVVEFHYCWDILGIAFKTPYEKEGDRKKELFTFLLKCKACTKEE